MKIFYHCDLDGMCSGAIVKLIYPEASAHKIQYGQAFPWESIEKDEEIWLVDFSLQPFELMVRLQSACGKLVWIDHHNEALKAASRAVFTADGLRQLGAAGCELTWDYCFPEKPRPEVVTLLGRYDVWDHSDEKVVPFQYGMREKWQELHPDNTLLWQEFFGGNHIEEVTANGQVIFSFMTQLWHSIAAKKSFELSFEGHKAVALNSADFGSLQLGSVINPELHDMSIIFCFDGKTSRWRVSLYSNKPEVDVGSICTKYGGGGHKGAGGFSCGQLPFGLESPQEKSILP